MKLNEEEVRNYHAALQQAKEKGMQWVVFDAIGETAADVNIIATQSLKEAQELCNYDHKEDFDYPALQQYMPLENMVRGLEEQLSLTFVTPKLIDPAIVESWLRKNNAAALDANCIQNIAEGYYEAVKLKQTILPADHVQRFHIIEHQYAQDATRASGHNVREALTTDNAKTALKMFRKMSNRLKDNPEDNRINLLLVASFRGEKLSLDLEGLPINNTGIALLDNFAMRDEENPYRTTRDLGHLHKSLELLYTPLAKYNSNSGQLEFYNSHFQRIDPLLDKPSEQYTIPYFSANFHRPALQFANEYEQLSVSLQHYGFNPICVHDLHENLNMQQTQFQCLYIPVGGLIEGAYLEFGINSERNTPTLQRFTVWENRRENMLPEFTVQLHQHPPFTYQEAKNLVEGRSVLKTDVNSDGIIEDRWYRVNLKSLDLDGKHPLHSYPADSFAVKEFITSRPIAEIEDNIKSNQLIKSLERGDRVAVTFKLPGHSFEQKGFIEAVPRFQSLNYFNENGCKIDLPEIIHALENKNSITQQREQPQQSINKSKGPLL